MDNIQSQNSVFFYGRMMLGIVVLFVMGCSTSLQYNAYDEAPIYLTSKCDSISVQNERIACANTRLLSDLYENIEYGGNYKEELHNTKAVVEFIVTKKGNVDDVVILRGVEEKLDASIIRFLKGTQWKPAKRNNRVVKSKNVFPLRVSFRD